jgi:hypothetical protein
MAFRGGTCPPPAPAAADAPRDKFWPEPSKNVSAHRANFNAARAGNLREYGFQGLSLKGQFIDAWVPGPAVVFTWIELQLARMGRLTPGQRRSYGRLPLAGSALF